MTEFEEFTCSLTTGDGVEIGTGIIVQIDPKEVLQCPSCLEKKVHGELSAQQPCYVLITAHSNVYEEDCGSETPEPSVVKCLGRNRKVVVLKSDELKTIDDSCVSCRAVSCCGIDSMLRMPQPSLDPTQRPHERPLHHTLKSHGRGKCNIGYDFVVVFLKAEVVRRWFPKESYDPPRLSLAQCSQLPNTLRDKFEVHMCWRSDKGSVEREKIRINTCHVEPQPEMRGLGEEISYFEAYQRLKYIQQKRGGVPGTQRHVGAPIVLRHTRTGTSHLIGINTGEGVTTFYGIFKLLKGGVVPFLAAMTHPTANARSLKPSRWKDYVLPHVDSHMHSLHPTLRGQYVVDLLHFLLEERAGATILKLTSSDDTDNVIAGLSVLTEILHKLKNGVHQCCAGIKCVRTFCSTDLNKCLQRYAQDVENPHYEDMVEAMFECFEALLNYEGVAREVLEANIQLLVKIATDEHYDSNSIVNRCCKKILLKYMKEEYGFKEEQQTDKKPAQATAENGDGQIVVGK